MHICIFEDIAVTNFHPLVYFRPVYELRCGVFNLREKILRILCTKNYSLHVRSDIAGYLSEELPDMSINHLPDEDTLLINGRLLGDDNLLKIFKKPPKDQKIFLSGNDIAAAFIKRENIQNFREQFAGKPFEKSNFDGFASENYIGRLVSYPWDLVHLTSDEIENDYRRFKISRNIVNKIYPGARIIRPSKVIIGKGSVVKPCAVLDADKGPIIIGRNVTVMPNAVIEGPAYIGDNAIIKIGAKIYHGTSIGEWCKVGGEVEASIIHSYSNKQHEGFLGHSYLGSWVNIGADTNTSDLKNNYSTVRVHVNGRLIDSGKQFVGLTMGDHSKSGINVMFDTGTVVGASCNIYGAGLPPKFVPSFAWGGEKQYVEFKFEKSIETMKRVMARRSVVMSADYEKLAGKIFTQTANERDKAGIK